MNKYLLLLCYLLSSSIVFAQKKHTTKLNLPPDLPIGYENCIKLNHFKPSERLNFYPFNKAATIELISIKVDTILVWEYAPIEYKGLPAVGDTAFYSYLNERKQLDSSAISQLTDILYNRGYNPKYGSFNKGAGCYEPRNAILFLDEKGMVFAYIELCFHCGNIRLSSDELKYGDQCHGKLELIKDLFQKAGIEYGTIYTY